MRKPGFAAPIAVTTHDYRAEGEIDFASATIAYAGMNWDGLRLKDVFEILAKTGDVFFYGPPAKWAHVNQAVVRGAGSVRWRELLKAYRAHGIALALSIRACCRANPNNRIFEGAAAGALVISSDYALVRNGSATPSSMSIKAANRRQWRKIS